MEIRKKAGIPAGDGGERKKMTGMGVKVIRYIAILVLAAVFGLYIINHEGKYQWYDFIAPLVTLAGFGAVLLAAIPKILDLLSGKNEFDTVEGKYKKRWMNFLLICIGALALHALTYALGIVVYGIANGKAGSITDWFVKYGRMAWMKPNTDAQHYINIAENWYQVEGDDKLLLVFFPMLPILIRGFNFIFNDSYLSATIINTAATALASGMTYITLLPVLGNKHSKAAAFIALLLPGAIFLNSPMTEPLFLLFTVCGFFFMQKRNYVIAGVFTALAGFTRSLGVLLAVPLALVGIGHIVSLVKEKKPVGKTVGLLIAGLFIACLGTLSYLYINYSLHGDPLKFLEYQWDNWNQKSCPFFDTPRYMVRYLISSANDKPLTSLSLWAPGLIAVFGSLLLMSFKAKKLPGSYSVYFLCYFAVSVGCTWLLSAVRYLCAALPFIAALADSCDKRWKSILIFSLTALMYLLYMVMYMKRLGTY